MMVNRLWAFAAFLALWGCATPAPPPDPAQAERLSQLQQLLPADAILLGEQHDAPDHQRIHRLAVETLASQQLLAAVAIEMVSAGQSTEKLASTASETQVQATLQWNNDLWPWSAYGPVVMAAVRAGVPVIGANLPTTRLREAMADTNLDRLLSGPALKAQQQQIRLGHCDLLPQRQISPMTRIQIARDVSMAQVLAAAIRPGKTVLLLAGSAHVDRTLGVPLHLPPGLKVRTVLLHTTPSLDANLGATGFDHRWRADAAPATDYCAKLQARQFDKPLR